jgi:hypothetical protein
MTRLPIPGSDSGNWGAILNEFLSVELNGDGTLKDTGSLAAKADDATVVHTTGNETIAGTKIFNTSPAVPTPTLPTQAANKSYVDTTVAAGAPDATTSNKGIVQLGGDLAGAGSTATAPVITDGAIDNNKIAVGAVSTSSIATGAVTSNEIANGTITNIDISASAAIAKSKLAALTIGDSDVSAISESKITNLVSDLAAKEAVIAAGTTSQYWRGDKTWQTLPTAPVTSVNTQTGTVTLTKSDVGLANVDNTSDANKPVSTAQATADNLRVLKSGDTMTGDLGVIGNYTLKDNATATKSYRFRTSGSSLDLETAGARMYFSAWDNANFTGTQHNYYAVDIYGFQATNHWYWKTSIDGTNVFDIDTGISLINVGDAANLSLGTTTGTKIGTSTSQKLAFYNSTPVVKPSGNALSALSSLGLVATPTLASSDVGLGNVDNTSDATKNSATATLTNKTLVQPIVKGSAVVALTDGASIATDASLGNTFTVTLGGNRSMGNPTNPTDGQKIIYRFKQDTTGSRTVTWGAAFRFGTDIPAPTLTTTASKTDYIGFIYNGTDSTWDCLAVTRGM